MTASFRTRSRPALWLHRGKVIALETGAALLVASTASAFAKAYPAAVLLGLIAVLVIAAAFTRLQGRPLADYVLRRTPPAPTRSSTSGLPGLVALSHSLPELRIAEAEIHSGQTVGLLEDGQGFCAVLEINTGGAIHLDLGLIAAQLAADPAEPSGVQLIVEQFRAPSPGERFEPAGSYLGLSTPDDPLARRVLLAVRHEPLWAPAAVTARGGGASGAGKAVAAATARLRRHLDRTGVHATMLAPRALYSVLAQLADSGRSGSARDHAWITENAAHCSLFAELRSTSDLARLVAAAAATPADRSVVSVAVELSGRMATTRAAVRVVSADHRRAAAARGALVATGLVTTLPGHQADGLRATLPLGGGRRELIDALGVSR
ncbi:type VII secretion protein EccE [Amycolatopsis sp. NPDC059027]|uniref:type VII secretion protein EccE n=1 Tax=Amycolatopsis sp. NPDC059027 TaxID=3346709 RepID=UPI0036716F57